MPSTSSKRIIPLNAEARKARRHYLSQPVPIGSEVPDNALCKKVRDPQRQGHWLHWLAPARFPLVRST